VIYLFFDRLAVRTRQRVLQRRERANGVRPGELGV